MRPPRRGHDALPISTALLQRGHDSVTGVHVSTSRAYGVLSSILGGFMRVRAAAATAALLLAALTACGGGDKTEAKPAAEEPAGKGSEKKGDCSDESLSQAERRKSCSDEE